MIKTSCQFCKFRNGQNCDMGLFPHFRSANVAIEIEQGIPTVGGVCMYRQPLDWVGTSKDNLAEIKTPVSFVVVYNDMESLEKTVKSIYGSHIVVVVEDAANNKDVQSIFNLLRKSHPGQYNVVGVYEKDNFELLFAEAFKRVKNGYCVLVESGFVVPNNWVSLLNLYVNFKQNKVLGITPVDGISGLTVYSSIFRLLRGNKGGGYFSKLIEVGGESYIKSWEQICQ